MTTTQDKNGVLDSQDNFSIETRMQIGRSTLMWWAVLLSALIFPFLASEAIDAFGHAFPGTLRTSVAKVVESVALLLSGVLVFRQLGVAHRLPAIRSAARIVVIIVYGLSAGMLLTSEKACGPRSEYVGGPKQDSPTLQGAQHNSTASCS
jgi:hypothetical protein